MEHIQIKLGGREEQRRSDIDITTPRIHALFLQVVETNAEVQNEKFHVEIDPLFVFRTKKHEPILKARIRLYISLVSMIRYI